MDKEQSSKLTSNNGGVMKDGFKGFYTPDSNALRDIWSSHETIFVFDTNVYLNIYSYAEKTKEDLFSIFKFKDFRLITVHQLVNIQQVL